MKNGSNEILEAKLAERSERAKKLYRYVSDVARRVGEATAASRSIADLFSTNIEVQRQKLRDNCEKLLFLDPLEYGKKSLELLWRKVYYETVSAAKKFKESDVNNDSYLFTHIVCGIGHFHHLMERVQIEMKMQYKELDYTPFYTDEGTEDTMEPPTEDELQFSRSVLHSCLIFLGDLSRYQVEIFQTFDSSIAARYYLQAAHIDMSSGMPYNQLGNLYLDKNYNLDSVCYYIICLGCAIPFEGAIGNLNKIFEKNIQFNDSPNDPDTMTQAEHIQTTIINFLSLIEIWYLGKNDTNIPHMCNTIAQGLKMSLEFPKTALPDLNKNYNDYVQAIEEEHTTPTYMNGNLIHKIVQICLFTIAKMSESDESTAFACKAFTLALLSQLLQKLLKQLELIGLKNPAHKYKPRTPQVQEEVCEEVEQEVEVASEATIDQVLTNGRKDVEDDRSPKDSLKESGDDNTEKVPNGDAKNISKKVMTKRRRRRRLASSESSDMSDEDTESSEVATYESCSDDDGDDDLSDSTCQSDDESPEGSEVDTDVEEATEKITNGVAKEAITEKSEMHNNTNGTLENLGHEPNILKENSKPLQFNVQELQNFLLGDNILPSIKLLQDWALAEKDLILSCGDSGEALFQCVVDLLNIFTYYFNSKITVSSENAECKLLDNAKTAIKKLKPEYRTIPLPEDIGLRGSTICKYDKDAAEWQILEKYKPSVFEENIIRILNFMEFGNQIAKIVPRIRFNRSMKIFYLKKVPAAKLNTKINHKRSREWHSTKKPHGSSESCLPRKLGRLWLAWRVRELERGQSAAPALLALDTSALHHHLRRVRQLLRAGSFVLLIPTVVLQELDNLKQEQSTARDAIRWLEVQLKNGSRFLKAQRPGQSKPLPLLKYPRKAPPHVHNFIQILEYCNHFIGDEKQAQGGNGDPDGSLQGKSAPLLILLVGAEPGAEEERYKEFSLSGAAQAAGISVQCIGDFYTKWRQSVHKNSKKR